MSARKLQKGSTKSFLCYSELVGSKRTPVSTTRVEEHRLKGKRKGALLKDQVWLQDGKITGYSLAYINLRRCPVDNGRVLGYDDSHDYHHRHFMGTIEAVEFTTYEALARRFYEEVYQLWRIEDEEG